MIDLIENITRFSDNTCGDRCIQDVWLPIKGGQHSQILNFWISQ
jgi:hypothetical protein